MYLSKIELDLRSPSVRQAIVDCQDMHRNVQGWFGTSRMEGRVLYRINHTDRNYVLYILSEIPPDNVANGAKLVGSRNMAEWENDFIEGNCFHFDLMAAPSKKVQGDGKNSRRRAFRTEAEYFKWMERKAAQNGFELLDLQAKKSASISGWKTNHRIIFNAVHYRGILRIVDEKLFKKGWENGIGPEKAYGMGMLMLVRR